MNKIFLLLVSAVLLMGIVSASALTDLQSNDVTDISVSMSAHQTIVHFLFNSEGQSWDNVVISDETVQKLSDGQLSLDKDINFAISKLLRGIDFTVNANDGATSPIVSNIALNYETDSVYSDFITLLKYSMGVNNLSADTLTELLKDYPSSTAMEGNAVFTKSGNDYTITYDRGLDDALSSYPNYQTYVQDALEEYASQAFDVEGLITDYVLPNVPMELDLETLTGLGFDMSNAEYEATIPGNMFPLKNGNYEIPVKITIDGEEIIKNIHLSLSGLPVSVIEVDDSTDEIVFDSTSSNLEEVKIPFSLTRPSTEVITLNMASLRSVDNEVTLVNNFKLERAISASNSYSAEIPAGTIISGGSSWNGIMTLPTVQLNSLFTAPTGKVNVVVELGSDDVELNFSKAVKIVLEGMTGKKAAWARGAGALTDISTECTSATNYSSDISPTGVRECYFDDGNDLIIWTYHFTSFSAYTPASTSHGSSHGGTVYSSTSTSTTSDVPLEVPKVTTETPKKTGFFSGITGAVTGLLSSGKGLVTVLVFMVVVAGTLVLFIVKKRRK